MKRIIVLWCSILFSLVLSAQEFATVKGKVIGDFEEIELLTVVDGAQLPYAKTNLGPDKTFGFTWLMPEEGFYVLKAGVERKYMVFVYLKPGDEVTLDIDFRAEKVELSGKPTREMTALYQWENYIYPIHYHSKLSYNETTYKEFFPMLEKTVAGMGKEFKIMKTKNPRFDELLAAKVKYDLDQYAIFYLYTPRKYHPEVSDLSPFYQTILSDKSKFRSDLLLHLPEGALTVSLYLKYPMRLAMYEGKKVTADQLGKNALSILENDALKGVFFSSYMKQVIRNYEQYQKYMELYGRYFVTSHQKALANKYAATIANSLPGSVAPNFTCPDIEGKMHSLTDYRGKVVLIDLWATWCAPCKGQIPYLQKLEEELQGRDIVFVSISIDRNKKDWEKFLKNNKMTGIQLYAETDSGVAESYKIEAIPRFIVVDKQGNIVSTTAPRPSDPKLKEMIQKYL